MCLRWLPTGDGGFRLVPSGEQQCPLGLMSLYWSQQPLLSKMNYRSPHSSESVICAQPAGQSSLLVAVVMDVNFHCRLLAPNSPGFTTQNKALKSFRLPPGTCRPVSDFFLCIILLAFLSARDACTCWGQQGGWWWWWRGNWSEHLSSVSCSPVQIKSECRVNPAPPKEEKKNLWICLELSFNLYFNVLFSNT